MQRTLVFPLVVMTLVGAAGCGGEDAADDSAVADQIKLYYAALARGNGEVACRLLTKEAARAFEAVLTGRTSKSCAANVRTLSKRSTLRGTPQVTAVSTTGKTARAHVSFQNPPLESDVLLVREDGVWKLAQIPAVVESVG